MKVGQITIHDTLNYGSLLQTVGLFLTLNRLGIDVELIDYKNEAVANRERIFAWNEVHSLRDVIRHFIHYKKFKQKKENYWKFLCANVKLTRSFTKENTRELNSLFDTFVVGSDIVWGTHITGHDYSYMLDFAEDEKKKIACSSSVGTRWQDSEISTIASLLSRFNAIGVRESQAAEWIKDIIGKEVPVTCDPTMLLTGDEWRKYIRMDNVPKGDYILVYMGTRNNLQHLRDGISYGKKHNLPVYYINYELPVCGVKNVAPLCVEDWLGLLSNAHTVFTASYHGLLFPMYFNRNFFFYNTRGSKARMESLANECGIFHREGNEENILNDKPIDWNVVNNIFESKRTFTVEFLKSELLK